MCSPECDDTRHKLKNQAQEFFQAAVLTFERLQFVRADHNAADYLLKYMQNASLFQTVATISIGNTVRLLGKPATAVALENLVQTMGYVKLLNQGPVERKRYAELLDIPNALLPYISNVEPGKGIILTPSGNVAFNDNFTELCPEGSFKDLFISG